MSRQRIACLAAAAFLPAVALAQPERILDTPTGWGYLYAATSTEINTQNTNGYRPFSLERVASGEYDTALVHNSGPYSMPGAVATFGRTGASMESYLNSSNLRLVDLEVYDSGGSTFMSAVAVPNSGTTSTPAWGWLYNTSFGNIVNWLNDNPSLRLIDLDVYTIGATRYYSAVAIHNSGANAQGWWYYNNITSSQVTANLTANGARLIQIDVVDPGSLVNPTTFACVMVSSNPGAGWWYP